METTKRPWLAYAITATLVVQLGCHALLAAGESMEAFAMSTTVDAWTGDPTDPTFLGAALLLAVGGLGQLGAFVLTILLFLTWFYRAAKTAESFATEPLQHGAGWAIGGFFVPFLNLIRPYEMARQIETASGGLASSVISAWWGAFIVNNIVGNIEFRVEAIDLVAYLSMLSTVTTGVAAYYCARMIFYVEKLQAGRVQSPEKLADVFA